MNDERDDDAPVIKVTDKRRFAKLAGVEGSAGEAEPSTDLPDHGTDDLAQAKARADEYLAHLQRLQAEFDNYRKRVLREQTTAVEMAAEPVMRRLLEVLLHVVEQLLGLAQQAELQVLGLLGHGVEGHDAERDRGQKHGADEN